VARSFHALLTCDFGEWYFFFILSFSFYILTFILYLISFNSIDSRSDFSKSNAISACRLSISCDPVCCVLWAHVFQR
jgi:hypothetical protein